MTFTPSRIKGGGVGTGIVALSGGLAVQLSTPAGSPVSLPYSVTIPAGSASATFTVNTSVVGANVSVPVNASLNLDSKTAVLTVAK